MNKRKKYNKWIKEMNKYIDKYYYVYVMKFEFY